MKRLTTSLMIIALLLLSINLSAQISKGGEPLSFSSKNISLLNSILPVISMPAIDIEKLNAEDIINDKQKEIPWRFGDNISVNIDIKLNGLKDVLPNGDKIWRLRIYSAGALTMNFIFDKYILPNNAKLFLYNEQKTSVFGAFTSFNNQVDQCFATTLIEGEAIVIEYFEPAKVSFEGQLHLSRVTHGYRNVLDFTMKAAKAFGSSGSCEFNVNCPLAAGWDNEIRSVCMLVTNSSGFCTGSLINNTSNDGTPYVLTANHCSSSNNFGSWVFWFNWQSPTCSNPTSSPAYQSISGCTLKARSSSSDFCLVQMSSIPPTNYNVYYSGWDRSGNVTQNTYAIHHPNGDIKKFSHATSTSDSIYVGIQCWNVFWSINGNGTPTEGVTEPGSSGSPIFDANHRIVGQLYGGPSACNQSGASNVNDFYGRFSYSWDSCGTTNAVRLIDWLDSANTGQTFTDGFNPVQTANDAQVTQIISPENFYCLNQVISPVVVIKNKGTNTLTSVIVNYKTDNADIVFINWTGSLLIDQTDTVTLPNLSVTGGLHTFKAFTSNPNNVADTNNYNDTVYTSFTMKGFQLPFSESFESSVFPPVGWSIVNSDNSYTWIRKPAYGIAGNFAAGISLYYYSTYEQKDELITPVIDLPVSNAKLTFYHAYKRKNANSHDSLNIFISKDCGATYDFVPIFSKSGNSLSTGSDTTNIFTPTSIADWIKNTIPLAQHSGNSIKIKFVSVSGSGNNLYIDNIQINYLSNIDTLSEENQIQVFPNPTNGFINLRNFNQLTTIQIFDLSGKLVFTQENTNPNAQLNIRNLSDGMYFLKVFTDEKYYHSKVMLVR